MDHGIDGVEFRMIDSMAVQQTCGEVALQRSKTKSIVTVAPQKKLDRAIAESADAVIENNSNLKRIHAAL